MAPLSNDSHSTTAPNISQANNQVTVDGDDHLTSSNSTILPDCPQPSAYVESAVLENLWRVVYWSSQCLTW